MKPILQDLLARLHSLVERLTSPPRIAGLEITDSGLQYLRVGKDIQALSLRFLPGVLRDGKILDEARMEETLRQLHDMAEPGKLRQMLPVVVALPPSLIYTQSLSIPNAGREHLEESADLNLQMIAPMQRDQAYASWQLIAESPDRFELLGAFAERVIVDRFRAILARCGFAPVALEFPSLALSRVIVEAAGTFPPQFLGFRYQATAWNFSSSVAVRSSSTTFILGKPSKGTVGKSPASFLNK